MKLWLRGAYSALVLVLAACDGSSPISEPEAVDVVQVTPASIELAAGGSTRLVAVLLDDDGDPITGRAITWSSSDSLVARVSADGTVTGRRLGSVTIQAVAEGRTGTASAQVTTNPSPRALAMTPSVLPAGTRGAAVEVSGTDFVPGAVVLWNGVPRATTYVNATLLRVDIAASDLLEGGTAQVVVQNPAPGGGAATALQFIVQPPPGPALRIDFDTVHVVVGDTTRLRALVYDANGRVVQNPGVVWTRLDNGTDFSGYGPFGTPRDSIRARGREIGSALLVATSGALSDTVVLRVRGISERITSVTAGAAMSCGRDAQHKVFCWGRTHPYVGTWAPAPAAGGLVLRSVDTGHSHACGLAADNRAWCWYKGGDGEFGTGVSQDSEQPVLAAGGRTFTSLVTGGWHTCGLTDAGSVWCWGANPYGQVGDGTQQNRLAPVEVMPGQAVRQVAAGGYHTCALTMDGRVFCWGYNSHGQAGPGSGDCPDPLYGTSYCNTRPTELQTGLRFSQVTVGGRHTCAVTAAGLAYCWGDGGRGQLGNGATDSSREPTAAAQGLTFTSIDAGFGNTCGLRAGGSIWCWGQNDFGNNGVSRLSSDVCIENRTGYYCNRSAVQVNGGLTFSSLSTGWYHTCAVTTTGSAYCWGENGTGETGIGSYNDYHHDAPTRVYDGGMTVVPGVSRGAVRGSSVPGSFLVR